MSDWKPELDSIERQADYLISLKIAERLAQDTLQKTLMEVKNERNEQLSINSNDNQYGGLRQ